MPLQNRVTPLGEVVAVSARGTMTGNRGIIHDPVSRTLLSRRWQHQAWICCLLSFKGQRHPIMGPGQWTPLFFLDEATALAAGHRPCGYCRRSDYVAFKHDWLAANATHYQDKLGGSALASVKIQSIDKILHRERVTRAREKVIYRAVLGTLPFGTFVRWCDRYYLLGESTLFAWSHTGYRESPVCPLEEEVEVLTPRSIVRAFEAGYTPSAQIAT